MSRQAKVPVFLELAVAAATPMNHRRDDEDGHREDLMIADIWLKACSIIKRTWKERTDKAILALSRSPERLMQINNRKTIAAPTQSGNGSATSPAR